MATISSKRARQKKIVDKPKTDPFVIEIHGNSRTLSQEELEQIRRVFDNIRKTLTVSCQLH